MKERPILFSTPMVRAILNGTKTQTRRLLKPQPTKRMFWAKLNDDDWAWPHRGQPQRTTISNNPHGPDGYASECPYGQPKDRLWVRETWQPGPDDSVAYKASGDINHNAWKPSIYMPRACSRILLEIESVRVERLQEITPDDLTAEGFAPDNSPPHDGTRLTFHGRKLCYAELWDSLNPSGVDWESNPWVWVVSFKKIG